jgi:hypothetical protein
MNGQRTQDNDIQDSVIGWWNNNKYDHLPAQTDATSKRKEAIVNDMVRWMKTSYTPVGGLGTSSRYIGKQGYGVQFYVWNVSHDKRWTDADGKFRPIPEENTPFTMAVNQLMGVYPIYFINKLNPDGDFYFTFPPDGYAPNEQAKNMRKGADPKVHPNVYNYVTRVNEWTTVYMAPNNQLPFVPVSKGELFQKAEEGLQTVMNDKIEEAKTSWPNSKKAQDEAIAYNKEVIEKYRSKIQQLKSKYSNSLNEPAVIRDLQPTMYSFETDPDLFKIAGYSLIINAAFPVYKIPAATVAKLNSVEPQWVTVSWPFENKERGNQLYEMYTALSQNINYNYIYHYFFAPEKVKGVAYTATDATGLKARLDAYRNTRSAKENMVAKKQSSLPAGVLLYDDFSQEIAGSKPSGWYFRTIGKEHTVTTIDDEKGQWLKLGYNNKTYPTALKLPLPENFTIEFDMATGLSETNWGATLELDLSSSTKGNDGKNISGFFKVKITAGNGNSLDNNYRGEIRTTLGQFPSTLPYNDQGGEYVYPLKEFNSNKRKVHIAVVKKGGEITVVINNQKSFSTKDYKTKYGKPCGECAFPANFRFTKLGLQSLTQDADKVGCYITNFKVSQN